MNESDSSSILVANQDNGTVSKGILTMVHTSIGAGLIAMPFAFACLGLIHGLLWSILSAIMSGFSLYCIAYVGIFLRMRNVSFYEVGKAFELKTFRIIVDLAIAFQGWGVCVSYLILIGSALPALIKKIIRLNTYEFIIYSLKVMINNTWICSTIVMFTVLYPLSLKRSIGSLWIMSIMALVAVCYIVALVTGYFILYLIESNSLITYPKYKHLPISWFRWSISDLMKGIPILIFGLTCHQNLFKVFNELASCYKTKRSMAYLASSSVTIVACIYSSIAVMGYITLGSGLMTGNDGGQLFDRYEHDDAMKHILSKYDPNHISLSIARISLIILVATAFPLQLHPARDAWGNIYRRFKGWIKKLKQLNTLEPRSDEYTSISEEFNSIELNEQVGDEHEPLLYMVAGLSLDNLQSQDIQREESTNSENFLFWIKTRLSCSFGTLLYCTTCLVTSIMIPNFSKILGLVGAIGANPIALFFGPYMYVKLCNTRRENILGYNHSDFRITESSPSFDSNSNEPRSWKYFFALFCMIFSITLMISVASHEIAMMFIGQ